MNIWGLSRYIISLENSRCLCYVTDCQGSLSGVSWSQVPDQVVCQGAGPTPAVHSSGNPQGLGLTKPVFCLVAQSTRPTLELLLSLSVIVKRRVCLSVREPLIGCQGTCFETYYALFTENKMQDNLKTCTLGC